MASPVATNAFPDRAVIGILINGLGISPLFFGVSAFCLTKT